MGITNTLTIGQVISRLNAIRKEHGNLDVALEYDTLCLNVINNIVVEHRIQGEGELVVVIKGC